MKGPGGDKDDNTLSGSSASILSLLELTQASPSLPHTWKFGLSGQPLIGPSILSHTVPVDTLKLVVEKKPVPQRDTSRASPLQYPVPSQDSLLDLSLMEAEPPT